MKTKVLATPAETIEPGSNRQNKYPARVLGTPTYEQIPTEDIRGRLVAVRGIVNEKVVGGKVQDTARLEITARDLAWVLDNGGTPVVWGHNGRVNKGDMLDFDTEEGQVVVRTLADILKTKYGHDLHYCRGVITNAGVDASKAEFVMGQANLLNNERVFVLRDEVTGEPILNEKKKPVMDHSKREFADSFKQIFEGKDVRTFLCSAYGDLGSAGPASHIDFLSMFKHVAWGPGIVQEILDTENIKDMTVIQFAGNKLDKIDTLYNLQKAMKLGGLIYLGSAIANQLRNSEEGRVILNELARRFNVIYPGQQPDPGAYNLAVPEVLKVDEVEVKGKILKDVYPDITVESVNWICTMVASLLTPGEKALFNGIPSWKEAGYIDSTRRVIHTIAESVRAGAKINLIGGDGPGNFKIYAPEVLGQLGPYFDNGSVTSYSGGGVPLKYATGGLKELVIAQAMSVVNADRNY